MEFSKTGKNIKFKSMSKKKEMNFTWKLLVGENEFCSSVSLNGYEIWINILNIPR